MTVTVVDTTAPSVIACDDVTVEQATLAGTEVTLSADVFDTCDIDPDVVWSHGPAAVFPLGDTEVTVTATDFSGNTATDTVVVHVVDTTSPELSCVESVNPHGNNVPGKNRGKNGKEKNQNPDGFYQLLAEDVCDAEPEIYVGTADDPYMFGPFENGIVIKFTETRGLRLLARR